MICGVGRCMGTVLGKTGWGRVPPSVYWNHWVSEKLRNNLVAQGVPGKIFLTKGLRVELPFHLASSSSVGRAMDVKDRTGVTWGRVRLSLRGGFWVGGRPGVGNAGAIFEHASVAGCRSIRSRAAVRGRLFPQSVRRSCGTQFNFVGSRRAWLAHVAASRLDGNQD